MKVLTYKGFLNLWYFLSHGGSIRPLSHTARCFPLIEGEPFLSVKYLSYRCVRLTYRCGDLLDGLIPFHKAVVYQVVNGELDARLPDVAIPGQLLGKGDLVVGVQDLQTYSWQDIPVVHLPVC